MTRNKPVAALQRVDVADMAMESDQNFYELYDHYYGRVRNFIAAIVKERWLAEDLTQDTFLRAFNRLHTLKEQSKVKSWLFRIAHNLCTDYFRSGKRDPARPIMLHDEITIPSPLKAERRLEQHEMSTCIQKHFLLLPDKLRPVLWLFDIVDFSHKEIAETLDISVENVKVRLHRARKRMKQILEENCSFEKDERDVLVCEPKNGIEGGTRRCRE